MKALALVAARVVVVAGALVAPIVSVTRAQSPMEGAGRAAIDGVHRMLSDQVGARVKREALSVRETVQLAEGRVRATVRADLRDACLAARRAKDECPTLLDLQTVVSARAGGWVVDEVRIERANDIDVIKEAQSKEAFARGDVEAAIRLMRESMRPTTFASLHPQLRQMLLDELKKLSAEDEQAERCTRSAMLSSRRDSSTGPALSQCDELRARSTRLTPVYRRALAEIDRR